MFKSGCTDKYFINVVQLDLEIEVTNTNTKHNELNCLQEGTI